MDEKKFVLCRLCLDVVQHKDNVVLDTISKNILLVVIPELNLDLTDCPIICKSCNETMMAYYEIKNQCNEKILWREGASTKRKTVFDRKRCYFCQNEDSEGTRVTKEIAKCVIGKCFPNWKLFQSQISLICNKCLESLKTFSKFASTSLETEKQIQKFCEAHGTDSRGKINLYEALDFILNSDVMKEFPESLTKVKFKTEIDGVSQLRAGEVNIKVEELDIKVEESEENVQESCLYNQRTLDLRLAPSTSREMVDKSTTPQNDTKYSSTSSQVAEGSSKKRRHTIVLNEAATSKQQRLVKIKPETRSIGIQVNIRDLVEHFSVGVQVNFSELRTNHKPPASTKSSGSNKGSTCKPKVIHARTLTKGTISNKNTIRKRGRKLSK